MVTVGIIILSLSQTFSIEIKISLQLSISDVENTTKTNNLTQQLSQASWNHAKQHKECVFFFLLVCSKGTQGILHIGHFLILLTESFCRMGNATKKEVATKRIRVHLYV